jgi:hypothetical protein
MERKMMKKLMKIMIMEVGMDRNHSLLDHHLEWNYQLLELVLLDVEQVLL